MNSVILCDVAPRDGLQNHATIFGPGVRAELVDRLAATGLPCIEAVSFVNPARVPQMAGAEEVVAAIERRPGVVYAGLALNERGYDRLLATGLDEVHFAFASTETFNERNQGAAVADSIAAAARIVARAREDGVRSTVTIGASFGCPFEGRVDPGRVVEIAGQVADAGARRDRARRHDRRRRAAAGPRARLCGRAARAPGRRPPAQHPQHGLCERHRRGRGGSDDARCIARRDRRLPVRTTCDREHRHGGSRLPPPRRGHRDGVDLDALIGVAEWLEGVLGHQLEGQVYRAGTFAPVAG